MTINCRYTRVYNCIGTRATRFRTDVIGMHIRRDNNIIYYANIYLIVDHETRGKLYREWYVTFRHISLKKKLIICVHIIRAY